MSLRRVDFFNKTAFSKYLPYEYQTTGSNEPLIAEFNVYFLHCTASAYLLILSLYRIMHDDTVKNKILFNLVGEIKCIAKISFQQVLLLKKRDVTLW